MRRPSLLLLAVLTSACATPWARVKEAKTIEDARKLLGAYEPQVTQYPPNAEAWNFGRNECVLFVDGKLRLSKTTKTVDSYESGAERERVPKNAIICSPSELKEP